MNKLTPIRLKVSLLRFSWRLGLQKRPLRVTPLKRAILYDLSSACAANRVAEFNILFSPDLPTYSSSHQGNQAGQCVPSRTAIDRVSRKLRSFAEVTSHASGNESGGRVRHDNVAVRPWFPAENAADERGVFCRSAAAKSLDRGARDAEVFRRHAVAVDGAVLHFRDQGFAC